MIKYGVVSASALLIGLGACTNKDAPIIESNTIEYKSNSISHNGYTTFDKQCIQCNRMLPSDGLKLSSQQHS